MLIGAHHRGGSTLLDSVFTKVCAEFGWRIARLDGAVDGLPDADVIILGHSVVRFDPAKYPFAGVHVLRDPRDIMVSGYEFHLETNEAWCTNTDFDPSPPIRFPRVPRSQQHRPEAWKQEYLGSLAGRSYQENLRSRSRDAGLQFEIDRYGGWTTEQMAGFHRQLPDVPVVRFEDLMVDFDGTFRRIFELLGLAPSRMDSALAIAATEDLGRRSATAVASNVHTARGGVTRWSQQLSATHLAAIDARFGDVISELGYGDETGT